MRPPAKPITRIRASQLTARSALSNASPPVFPRDTMAEENPDHEVGQFTDADGLWHGPVAETVVAAERDGAVSHGLLRLPGYVSTLKSAAGSTDAQSRSS